MLPCTRTLWTVYKSQVRTLHLLFKVIHKVIKCTRFYRARAMLRHEWAGSAGVIPRPHRKPPWNNACIVFCWVSTVSTGGPNHLKRAATHLWLLWCWGCPWAAVIAYHQRSHHFVCQPYHIEKVHYVHCLGLFRSCPMWRILKARLE